MGNTNRALKGGGEEGIDDVPPAAGGARVQALGFHEIHSEHIQLSLDGRTARRVESFCKGICFSNRPVAVNERIYVRISEVSTSWSGVLRLGFTSVDPATIDPAQLPRYACPDLTTRQGYWAKALPERFAEQGTVIVYGVTRSGDVRFGVNGQDKGIFFADVNTSGSLWALIDIYGNSTGMQFIDEEQYNTEIGRTLRLGNGVPDDHVVLSAPSPEGNRVAPTTVGSGSNRHSQTVNGSSKSVPAPHPPLSASGTVKRPPGALAASTLSPPLPQAIAPTSDGGLSFHATTGRNVVISSSDRRTASRRTDDYCNGYVLTNRPLRPGEKIVVQITRIDITYEGTLAFGLTSCDPASLTAKDLPDDSDLLLDRPEYWVVYKDVCAQPQVTDELSFQLMPDGEVKYSRNGQAVVSLVFVDMSLPLWGFFDIYGSVQTIKLAGPHRSPQSHPIRQDSSPSGPTPLRSNSSAASLPANLVTPSPQGQHQLVPRKSVTTMESIVPRPAATPPPPSSTTPSRITPPPRPSQPASRNSPQASRKGSQPPAYSSVVSASAANAGTPPSLPPKHGRSGASPAPAAVVPPIPSRPSDLLRQADNLSSSTVVNRLPPPLIPMPADNSPASGHGVSFGLADINDSPAPPNGAPPALPAKSSNVQPPSAATADATSPRIQQPQSLPINVGSGATSQQSSFTPHSPVQSGPPSMPLAISAEAIQNANNECVVCMERPSNSVVYACGHLCLCWDCATNIRNHARPLCPICQQEVKDIIKIFRS